MLKNVQINFLGFALQNIQINRTLQIDVAKLHIEKLYRNAKTDTNKNAKKPIIRIALISFEYRSPVHFN